MYCYSDVVRKYFNHIEHKCGRRTLRKDVSFLSWNINELPYMSDIDVIGDYVCGSSNLISLKGSPKSVSGNFTCRDTDIENLQFLTKSIGGDLYIYNNLRLKSLKGLGEIGGKIYCDVVLPKDDYFIQYALMDKILILNKI